MVKIELTIWLKTCTVYQVSCSCCNACYMGQTKRSLETTVKEHVAKQSCQFQTSYQIPLQTGLV